MVQKRNTAVSARELPDWLIAHGRHWTSLAEIAGLLGVPLEQVPPVMARLRNKGQMFSPLRGIYVPIPPEYRTWQTVPASHFIDPMMRHLDHPYYVGLLSAAEVHGAAHQRPQVFQVVTTARLREHSFGRVKMAFITDARADERPFDKVNTPMGTMNVSTPEITLLDLVASPRHGGGLSNVATVVGELIEERKIDFKRLAREASAYSLAVTQRTGWLIDYMADLAGVVANTEALAKLAHRRNAPSPLTPNGRRAGPIDQRWNVWVNIEVEPDL